MQRIGVLFVSDAVIALDLAEILALELQAVQLMTPQTTPQAVASLKEASFLITDQVGWRDLDRMNVNWSIPTIILGSDQPMLNAASVTHLPYPFTNETVYKALDALDLITSHQHRTGTSRH